MKTRNRSRSKDSNAEDAWRLEDKARVAKELGAKAYRPFDTDKDHGEEHLHPYTEKDPS